MAADPVPLGSLRLSPLVSQAAVHMKRTISLEVNAHSITLVNCMPLNSKTEHAM